MLRHLGPLPTFVGGLVVLVGLALPVAGEFRSKTADKYPTRQRQGDLIVAVRAFVSEKDQKSAFGKVRPYQYGVTPLLVVMSNTGRNSYSLEDVKIRLIMADRESLEPISAEELATFNPRGHQPTRRSIPGVPGLNRTRVKKGPLAREEIALREFRAPIITPQSTASGFLYYFTGTEEDVSRASAYISGVYDITNGRDLFYFEIPLSKGR